MFRTSLGGLDRYERAKIADALEEIEFEDNDFVITMGEPGDTFFICVEVSNCTLNRNKSSVLQTRYRFHTRTRRSYLFYTQSILFESE
jgi:hypothetical protein